MGDKWDWSLEKPLVRWIQRRWALKKEGM